MKVNHVDNNISFNGLLNNKILKKGLEFAADNGTLFAATTTLALSTIRPLVILATPNTDKKNKQIACSKSLISTLTGYAIALMFSRPLSNSIKKINNTPEKYLTNETITNLKDSTRIITESKAYSFATQLFKLGLGIIIAAPKSILTAIGTPYMADFIDSDKVEREISFKGKDHLTNIISKILNKKKLHNFANRHKDSNFPMHIVAASDTIATTTFICQTNNNKKLNEKDKKPLIYNTAISTFLSIVTTYIIDFLTKNKTDKFIEKYRKINANQTNLAKQIEGIRVAKPIIIAGSIYYIIIPLISTFLADRIGNTHKH